MSRHRFDHSVDHSDDTKEVSAPARSRRIDVITGAERRRKWSAEEKAAIVAESLGEGAVVSEVARRHGLSPQQLFGCRARLRGAVKGSAPSCDATPSFVPAIVENEPPSPAAPAHTARLPAAVTAMGASGVAPASIEIALGGGVVRVRGAADPLALTAVLKALRGRP
jgi:transposase